MMQRGSRLTDNGFTLDSPPWPHALLNKEDFPYHHLTYCPSLLLSDKSVLSFVPHITPPELSLHRSYLTLAHLRHRKAAYTTTSLLNAMGKAKDAAKEFIKGIPD